MTLPSPNLDDRTFAQLLDQAREHLKQRCPDWEPSVHDPGMVLLELFAHLTETMIYRLNRLPEKAYVEFLRLAGVALQPAAAASATLRFEAARPADRDLVIPEGTRVTSSRAAAGSDPVVFVTDRTVSIPAGATRVAVTARHCELVAGELLGLGTGQPGLDLTLRRPPIIARTEQANLDLRVAVEAVPGEPADFVFRGKPFQVWTEVTSFAGSRPQDCHYMADRMSGLVTFAPAVRLRAAEGALAGTAAALAAIPGAQREIRAWYRRGGGPAGNVAAGMLDTLKDPIPGVQVSNPDPATGGTGAETLANALHRAPVELYTLRRAVTASDFETLARVPGIARAKAFTQSQLWQHAAPGTVEVRLVPALPAEAVGDGPVTEALLRGQEVARRRAEIQDILDQHRPLGTHCVVDWAHYKAVRIKARLVANPTADITSIAARIRRRLHQTLTPLPSPARPSGWPFGQALYSSDVYNIILAEPGVHHIEGQVLLCVDQAPGKVRALCADPSQPHTIYAGSGADLFRTVNAGDSWERIAHYPGEDIERIVAHPRVPGLVAVATERPGGRARVHVSRDCGERWLDTDTDTLEANVHDIAWVLRGQSPVLLLATAQGLFERVIAPRGRGVGPVRVTVDGGRADLGFRAVAVAPGAAGREDTAAVAAVEGGGVYRSVRGGQGGSFEHLALRGEYVHTLAIQPYGTRADLWAGLATTGGRLGCFVYEGVDAPRAASEWRHFQGGWQGGSCLALAFHGSSVLAGTHEGGVLLLDPARGQTTWQGRTRGALANLDQPGKLHPVEGLAVSGAPGTPSILVGFAGGVARSQDGQSYELCSRRELSDQVRIPPEWLICSAGEHDIEVRYDHGTNGY